MSKLHFRYSAMAAGKSIALLTVAFNYEERNMKVLVISSQLDNRSGVGVVSSRIGLSRACYSFEESTDFEELLSSQADLSCVLIDEAQFLNRKQVEQLHRVAHLQNLPVICFGLRSDFQGQAFPGSAALLALADDLEELRTICSCGRKASMNMRVDEYGLKVTEGNQVEIGGNNRYRSVCPKCFYGPYTAQVKAPVASRVGQDLPAPVW
jgi:thymidine kinase